MDFFLQTPAPAAAPPSSIAFSTTFNFAAVQQRTSGVFWTDATIGSSNDGIKPYLNNITVNGNWDSIETTGNNTGGGGGCGLRHIRGQGGVTPGLVANDVGGGILIDMAALGIASTDFWLRYYTRHALGFAYTSNNPEDIKDIFIPQTGNWFGLDGTALRLVSNGANYYSNSPAGWGWDDINGGTTGDGQWHYFDLHFVSDTNGTDGVFEAWCDGTRRLNYTNVNHEKLGTTFNSFNVGSNGKYPSNSNVDMYQDYDDIAISLTGRIGAYDSVRGY